MSDPVETRLNGGSQSNNLLYATVAAAAAGIGVAVALLTRVWIPELPWLRLQESASSVVGVLLAATSLAVMIRLLVMERRRTAQLAALYDAMRSVQQSASAEAGARELLNAIRSLFEAEAAWITLLPASADELPRSGFVGREVEVPFAQRRMTPSQKHALDVALGARGALSVERSGDGRTGRGLLDDLNLQSGLLIALRGDSGPVGALLVGNPSAERGAFGRGDLTLLETFAGHVSLMIENDRLTDSLNEVNRLQQELRHAAVHDALTALPNRTLFVEQVSRALTRADGATAVLFLDLDDFKVINDSLGHHAGDELLVAVAARVKSAVRPTDIPARLGGDEFAVLAPGADAEVAEAIAERLLAAMDDPFAVNGREVSIRASVGVAVGTGSITAGELLRNADVAMYAAKGAGKRRFAVYEKEMHIQVRRKQELATALERAIERDEITVHYQPIVELATGRLAAVEALVRWDRNELGLFTPSSFIPLADEIGLMPDIGRVVLRRACSDAVSWQQGFAAHEQLRMNVNLAPSELHDRHLVQEVAQILDETGLDPGRLVLEITETGVMRRPAEARRTMEELRALGVALALDDFGTGHSSLAYLREFPLDSLKIAGTFVSGVPDAALDGAFLETIARLASTLGLSAVAEGVETEEQAVAVAAMGCEYAQGYLFGEPLSPIGATQYLSAGSFMHPARLLSATG